MNVFSDEWVTSNGLKSVVTPEALKVIIAQAMTLAQKAQHLGIRVTLPQPGGAGPAAQACFGTAPAPGSAANGQIPLAPQFVPGAFSPGAPVPADPQARAWETA